MIDCQLPYLIFAKIVDKLVVREIEKDIGRRLEKLKKEALSLYIIEDSPEEFEKQVDRIL